MNEETGTELARTAEPLPLALSENFDITADVIRKADAQVEGLLKIKAISLRLTNSADWAIFDGKPCLQNSGIMKIASLWGVSFLSPLLAEERRDDDRGEYITFTCNGKARWRGREIEDIGTSSTRDKLLGSVGGKLRPMSEVDLPSVKKMAVTNWQSRILKKILGLSFEMEDLEKAGIRPATKTSYAKGGGGGGLISEAQGKRLYAISKSGNVSEEACKAVLKGFGYASSKEIKREDYEAIVKMIEDKGNSASGLEG